MFRPKFQADPPPIEPTLDRLEVARSRMAEVKSELDALNADILTFKTKHALRLDRFDQIIGMLGDSITARFEVEKRWRVLMDRRVRLIARWNPALEEWAAARIEREQREVTYATHTR